MPTLPDPTAAAERAARATLAHLGPDLDAQSVAHHAKQSAASWLTGQGVSHAQWQQASDQDPISRAYSRYVTAFRLAYDRLAQGGGA